MYGDIHDTLDADVFSVDAPWEYEGSVTIQLRTAGISSLASRLEIYDVDEQLLGTVSGGAMDNGHLTLSVDATINDEFFVKVTSASDDVWGVGGYALVVTFDEINQLPVTEIDQISGGTYRDFDDYDLRQLIGGDDRYARDHDNDDRFDSSVELRFTDDERFKLIASLDHPADVDIYEVEVEPGQSGQEVITVVVRPLDASELMPSVEVFGSRFQRLTSSVLANNMGTLVLQVSPAERFFVKVSAAENSSFRIGNYELEVALADTTISLAPMAEVVFDGNHAEQKLYVGKPQLFHLLGTADGPSDAPAIVQTKITSANGAIRYDLVTPAGQTRSGDGVLLMPGEYDVTFDLLTPNNEPPSTALEFTLRGAVISDPLAIDLVNPFDGPFDCANPGGGEFCDPHNTATSDPFAWGEISTTTISPTDVDAHTLATWIEADWWECYFSPGETGEVPTANADSYQLNSNAPLLVNTAEGLLSNDVDPEGNAIIAVFSRRTKSWNCRGRDRRFIRLLTQRRLCGCGPVCLQSVRLRRQLRDTDRLDRSLSVG